MLATRTTKLVTIATTLFALTACSYDCGTRRRTVASGAVRDAAGTTLATANVDLSDNVNPSFLRLSVGVTGSANSAGAPLKGHVTRARLLTEAGELAEIPTSTATLYVDVIVALNVNVSSAEYDRVRGAILTNRTRVVLDTDLVGREHIETTLTGARDEAGEVGRCTPA